MKPSLTSIRSIAMAVGLSTAVLTVSLPVARAGVESDVFARLLAKAATTNESMTVARYILRNSAELRQLSREILAAEGVETSRMAEETLTEKAIRRLKKSGDTKTATLLERRLLAAEEDFTLKLTQNPKAEMESVLAEVSTERFQRKAFKEGKNVAATGKALSTSESALARALKPATGARAAARETNAEITLAYDRALMAAPELERYLPKGLAYDQIADAEMTDYTDQLGKLLAELAAAPGSKTLEQNLRASLRKTLRNQVPASSITARVNAFMAAKGEREAISRALGDMTLAETNELYFGLDPLRPSPESLLGQYLKETGATKLVRRFDDFAAREAGARGAMGPNRLVVSLSAESLPIFLKYFGRKEWMSVIKHAFVVHDGVTLTHEREASRLFVPGTEYTPFPMLQLKSTEGQRLKQYLQLFKREAAIEIPNNSWDSRASAPWELKSGKAGYCAKSAWSDNCTQHIGNIPIGDTRVVEYVMPGEQVGREINPEPVRQMLKPYVSRSPLLKRVWKVPGNQILSETIGQQAANLRGEFANPGWLINTLMGSVSAERVPVVFVARPDHRAPILENFKPAIEDRF